MKNPFSGLFRARDKPKNAVSAANLLLRLQLVRQVGQPAELHPGIRRLRLRPGDRGNHRVTAAGGL